MGEVHVESLKPNVPPDAPLFHRTGELLFTPDRPLLAQNLAALQAANIATLYTITDPADLARLKKRTGLHAIRIDNLKLNRPLPHDICNEQATVLISRNTVFQAQHRKILAERNLTHVYIPSAEALRELDNYRFHATQQAADAIDSELASKPDLFDVPRNEPPFLASIARIVQRTADTRAATLDLRSNSGEQAGSLLSSLRDAGPIKSDIPSLIDHVIQGFTKDANFLLKLASLVKQDPLNEDPRADHLINVCLNAIAIGTQMGYSEKQLKRLGMCAFLHDIGMIRVPADILLKPGPLEPMERVEVERHTIHALDLLEKIPSLPPGAFLPIYQSHERIDGSGYPKRRRPPFIHEFARIIAVADTYTAMCSPRVHRHAKSPHDAMTATIQLAAANALDKTVLRAFLHAVGLFPIGSWILLSTGETARVVGTGKDPARYDRPSLSLQFARDGAPLNPPLPLELADAPATTISQVLPPDTFQTNSHDGF